MSTINYSPVNDRQTTITVMQAAASIGVLSVITFKKWSKGESGPDDFPFFDDLFVTDATGRILGVRVAVLRAWASDYVRSVYGVEWTGAPVGRARR